MKKTILIPLFLIATGLLTWYACEKETEEPPAGQTNKIVFKDITIESVSYRKATLSYSAENIDLNDVNTLGICYNTSGEPTPEDNTVSLPTNSSGTKTIDGLSPDKEYHLRLYAEISGKTLYSVSEIFSTNPLGTPAVSTGEITDTTATSAMCGGEVTDKNGSDVTAKGVCWNKTGTPTDSDNKTNEGTGLGSFTSNMDNLEINTTYYVRAYATNDAGTAYGTEKSFTTDDGLPELTTNEITDITASSATSGGNITDNGGFSITARGVCWSNSQNPTVSDNHTNDGTGTGSFTSELTGLTEGTTYYVRAYATNSVGTAYGEERNFVTELQMNGTFTDSRDGQTYEWVRIGDQVWMAENLNYDQSSYGNDWCFENNSSNCDTYGRLYDWAAVMQGESSSNSNPSGVQGVCPDGWHVPSDEEWKELEMQLGMSQSETDNTGRRGTNEGSKLAGNASLWNDGDLENNSAFGSSGFTALPGGYRDYGGSFYDIGGSGGWWSSSEGSSTDAWGRGLGYDGADVYRSYDDKDYGFSVRCVRD